MNANTWTDETLIGAGTATLRDGTAFAGQSGEIAAYAHGTAMLRVGGGILPFGLGEIAEIRQSKGDGAKLAARGMKTFLKFLSDWAETNGAIGRTIESAPLEGPGIMRWIAR